MGFQNITEQTVTYRDKIDIVTENKVSEYDNKEYLEFEITISELHGYGAAFFNPPLIVRGCIQKGKGVAHFHYDFGMDCKVPITKKSNCLYDYNGDNPECDPIKTVFSSVKYDLLHAFNHYDGDPNFGHRHWALRECLKDRTVSFDWYEDVKEYKDSLSAQMEFDFGS